MREPAIQYIRGGAIHARATSVIVKTGGWRLFRPVLDPSKCKRCKLCYWFCPDSCITITDEAIEIDYQYCKGCGICCEECPTQAISMDREEDSP
ncbi:MAG: 4Fe-4S binding protein [Thermodesulfobacteriota bacterium]